MQHRQSRNGYQKGQVKIEFSPKLITSWGGTAALFSRFFDKLRFWELVEKIYPDKTGTKKTITTYQFRSQNIRMYLLQTLTIQPIETVGKRFSALAENQFYQTALFNLGVYTGHRSHNCITGILVTIG